MEVTLIAFFELADSYTLFHSIAVTADITITHLVVKSVMGSQWS